MKRRNVMRTIALLPLLAAGFSSLFNPARGAKAGAARQAMVSSAAR
jgi:hypothetical protein